MTILRFEHVGYISMLVNVYSMSTKKNMGSITIRLTNYALSSLVFTGRPDRREQKVPRSHPSRN